MDCSIRRGTIQASVPSSNGLGAASHKVRAERLSWELVNHEFINANGVAARLDPDILEDVWRDIEEAEDGQLFDMDEALSELEQP